MIFMSDNLIVVLLFGNSLLQLASALQSTLWYSGRGGWTCNELRHHSCDIPKVFSHVTIDTEQL